MLKERNPHKQETQPWSHFSCFYAWEGQEGSKGCVPSAAAVLSCSLLCPPSCLNTLWMCQAHIPIFLTFPFPAVCPPHHSFCGQSVTCPTLNPALPNTCNKLTQSTQ